MTTISVLIEQDAGWWVAQCLQVDLATQAHTLDDLHRELHRLLVAHIVSCEELGIEPFEIPAAPPEVWEKFARAKDYMVPIDMSGPQPMTRRSPPIVEARLVAD